MGGLLGPRPQKPGGHLENLGANGPWAPVSFEPWRSHFAKMQTASASIDMAIYATLALIPTIYF